jgi:acylphosphatase
MSIARRCLVKGYVQGVGFRYFVLREAGELGICGYVRNLPNGDVEAVLEGSPEAVEALISRLRQGSPFSQVEQLELQTLQPTSQFRDFSIRR